MSIFGSSKKIISQTEFKELQSELYSKGFNKNEREEVEKIFRGDLNESSEYERGIDAEEIENALKWMRENMKNHNIPSKKIDLLEELLKAKL